MTILQTLVDEHEIASKSGQSHEVNQHSKIQEVQMEVKEMKHSQDELKQKMKKMKHSQDEIKQNSHTVSFLDSASQIIIDLSKLPDTILFPFGENETDLTFLKKGK